ncbi:MAG: TonB-dependent receptor [Richelia sp. SM1_7_0]|nr:TonB-dependent receptor [Richelia sp. SM1_7_0]
MVGEISPGWKIIANYAYTDAVVTKDNSIPIGDRLYGVPKNSASLWTTYEFKRGSLQGLGLGAGLVFYW